MSARYYVTVHLDDDTDVESHTLYDDPANPCEVLNIDNASLFIHTVKQGEAVAFAAAEATARLRARAARLAHIARAAELGADHAADRMKEWTPGEDLPAADDGAIFAAPGELVDAVLPVGIAYHSEDPRFAEIVDAYSTAFTTVVKAWPPSETAPEPETVEPF